MLNNKKMRIIYENWKLIFRHDKLHNGNTPANKITIIDVIPNRTTSKNIFFVSDVNYKCILHYSIPTLGICTRIMSPEK